MDKENKYKQLRQKAEMLLKQKGIEKSENYYGDIEKLVEELNIHQIELEMQNQEMQETNQKLVNEQNRYKELYLNAPVAYFTLNQTGNIIELNHAAADLLKIPIQAFRYTSIFPYLNEISKKDFSLFFKKLFHSKKTEYGEIVFKDSSGNLIFTTLSALVYFDNQLNDDLVRLTVTDLSVIKQFESQVDTQKKLIDSENRMRMLFDKNGVVMLVINPETGQIEDANATASNFYGYSIEKLKTMNIAQINQLSESEVKAEIENTRKSGKKYFNFKHKLANGQIRDVEVYSTAISFDKTDLLYSIILDITERKQIEKINKEIKAELKTANDELNTTNEELNTTIEELDTLNEGLNRVNIQISEERKQFLSILDSIPQLIYVSEFDTGKILFANRKLKEITGRDITGEKCFEAIQGKKETCDFCTSKYIRENDKPYFWEYYNPVVKKHFYIMDRKIRWTDNKEVRFELAIDITEQKKSEEENKKLSIAVEQNPISIVITNLNGDIEYVNPTFTLLTGYTKEDVIGNNPRVLKSGKTSPEIFTDLWKTITAGKTWSGQFINKTKKGDEFIEKATISPIFNEIGKKINYIAIKEDITEKVKIENQIKRNEKIHRIAFESANIGIMNVGKSGEILYANEECTHIFGYSKEELKTMTVNDIAVPDDKNVSARFIKTALKDNTHEKAVFVKRYFHKNGNIITCEISSTLLHDTNNEPLYFISHIKDITKEKQAEEKLRKSEENLKSIIENSSNVFYKHDVNHKLTFLSPQIKDFLGYEPQEAKRVWTELTTDNHINKTAYDITEKAIETGERQDVYDAELQHKDGSKIWVEVREAPIVKNGKTVEIVGALTDVTEKRKFEQILKASEEKYRLITENASDVIWILNITKEKFTYISPSVYALRGYTPEEAMQQDINQSLTPESAKEVVESIGEILPQFLANPTEESKRIHRHELQQTCKDGSIIWIETTTRYQFNSDNEIEVIGISRNIEDRKKYEERIKRNTERLNDLLELSQQNINDKQQIFDYALNTALKITQSEYGFVHHYSESEQKFYLNSWSNSVLPECKVIKKQTVYELKDTGLWGEVVRQRKPIMVNDLSKPNPLQKGFPAGHVEIIRFLSVPFISDNKIVAIVAVANKTNAYSSDDILQLNLLMETVWNIYNKKETETKIFKLNNELKEALQTKEVLLKEVHHRVKNNLQTISSLLYQQQTLSNDPKIAEALRDSMNRVSTMALIHQFIYKSPDLKNINMKSYITDLVGKLANTYNQTRKGIIINTEIEEINFDIEKTIPVALIINEVLSNIFKYAFTGKENGIVNVRLTKVDNEKNKLVISDNGIGLPEGFKPEKSKSLGMYLIKNFAKRQLKGTLQIISKPNEGVKYEIEF